MAEAFAVFAAWFIGIVPIILRLLTLVVASLLLTWLLPKFISRINSKVMRDDAVTRYVVRTVKILVWLVAVIVALEICGFPVASLLTFLAAVGAAIALAIRDNLANLASGIVLLFTKPFKAGDFIAVDGTLGTIREINIMQTYLDTLDNTLAAVPNSKMVSATITNYSAHEKRRQDLFYTVAFETDLAQARNVLMETARAEPMVLREPSAPLAAVWEHRDNGIVLLLRVWSATADVMGVRYALNEAVKKAFEQAGIGVPSPRLRVDVKE